MLADTAAARGWDWDVRLVPNPDPLLAAAGDADAGAIVATADSVILDRCRRWFSLAGEIVGRRVPDAWLIDFADAP
jgi:hypothetical protein